MSTHRPPPSRLARGLRWLLVASLALNVAVLAGVAWHHFEGGHMRQRMRMHHMGGVPMPSPMALRRALPEDRRAVLDETLARHRPRIGESVRAVMQARRHAHELMTAEEIDPQALATAFADLRARDAEAAEAVQAMLADLLPRLTPEERRALGESMHRRLPRDRQSH